MATHHELEEFEDWTQAYNAWAALMNPKHLSAARKLPPVTTFDDVEEPKPLQGDGDASAHGSDVSTHMGMDDFGRCFSEGSVIPNLEDLDHAGGLLSPAHLTSAGSLDPPRQVSSCSLEPTEESASPSSAPASTSEASVSGAARGLQDLAAGWATALQRDVLASVTAPDFQEQLRLLLRERGGPDAAEHLEGRSELCLAALGNVLPAYGYAASVGGLEEAFHFLEAMAADLPELESGLHAIYDGLGRAPPSELALGAPVPWSV